MERAVEAALGGMSNSEAARVHQVSRSALKLALRRRGVAPKPHPSGDAHHERQAASCAAL
jgi:predicted HTH domain antitoxin